MRSAALAGAFFLPFSARGLHSQAPAAVRSPAPRGFPSGVVTSTQDAEALAQGFGRDGGIDADARAELLGALEVVRSTFPWTRSIHARLAGRLDTLELRLSPDGAAAVRAALARGAVDETSLARGGLSLPPAFREARLRSTGLPKLDELNVRYGAKAVTARRASAQMLRIRFGRPMDLEALGRFYRMVPEVQYAGPVAIASGADDIERMREGRKWHLVFKTWRDCSSPSPMPAPPKGGSGRGEGGSEKSPTCRSRAYHYFTYDLDTRKARWEYERLNEASGFCAFHLWGIPDTPDVCPFLSYRNLVEKTRDPAWWIARVAVRSLGFLLTNPKRPAHPEDARPKGHFEMIRDAVVHRREQGLLLLVEALAYPNAAVSEQAYEELKAVTQKDLGAGPEGRRRWRQWLDSGDE